MKSLFCFLKTRTAFILLINFTVISSIAILFLACQNKREAKLKKPNHSAEIKRLIKKADLQFDTFQNDSSVITFNKAIALCDPKENYPDDYVYSLTIIANILQNDGDIYGSEAALTKTLPYLKKTSKPKFIYNVYTLIAYNYLHNYDYKNAILYHKKALNLAQTTFKKSVILTDIAITYHNDKKYSKAIKILEPLTSKSIKHESNLRKTINHRSIVLNNLGFCYLKVRNPKALNCLEESLQLTLELEDEYELIGAYNILSLYHFENNNFNLAKIYAEKAYSCAVKAKAPGQKAYCLEKLIPLSKGENLRKYALEYINLIDSIADARKKMKNQSSNIKYNSNRDKEKNLFLKAQKAENELQLQRQKNRSFISYTIISLAITILFFLYFNLTSKRKKENIKATYQSEARIAKKLHAELAYEVYQTLTLAEITDLQQKENKEILLSHLDQIYSKTRNISKENSLIQTDRNYPQDLKEMISSFKTSNLNIFLNGFDTLPWNKIEKNKKITVYRIIQEVLLNSVKHNNTSLVSLSFKLITKKITFTYISNGSQTDYNKQILKNDLQNVENRIKTINGTITFDNNFEKGIKISFTFPL